MATVYKHKAFYLLNCTISIFISTIIITITIKQYLLLEQLNNYIDSVNLFLDSALSFKTKINQDTTEEDFFNNFYQQIRPDDRQSIQIAISSCNASVGSCINKTPTSIINKIQNNELDINSKIINIYNSKQYIGNTNSYPKNSEQIRINKLNTKLKKLDRLLFIDNKRIVVIEVLNANKNGVTNYSIKFNINNSSPNIETKTENIKVYKLKNVSYLVSHKQKAFTLSRLVWCEQLEPIADNIKNLNIWFSDTDTNKSYQHYKNIDSIIKISIDVKKPTLSKLRTLSKYHNYKNISFTIDEDYRT